MGGLVVREEGGRGGEGKGVGGLVVRKERGQGRGKEWEDL